MKILHNDKPLLQAAELINDSAVLKQQLVDYARRLEYQAQEEQAKKRELGQVDSSESGNKHTAEPEE